LWLEVAGATLPDLKSEAQRPHILPLLDFPGNIIGKKTILKVFFSEKMTKKRPGTRKCIEEMRRDK
jgi:hypothetical protein